MSPGTVVEVAALLPPINGNPDNELNAGLPANIDPIADCGARAPIPYAPPPTKAASLNAVLVDFPLNFCTPKVANAKVNGSIYNFPYNT